MEGSIKELSAYRYETAQENLQDAKIMYDRKVKRNSPKKPYVTEWFTIYTENMRFI